MNPEEPWTEHTRAHLHHIQQYKCTYRVHFLHTLAHPLVIFYTKIDTNAWKNCVKVCVVLCVCVCSRWSSHRATIKSFCIHAIRGESSVCLCVFQCVLCVTAKQNHRSRRTLLVTRARANSRLRDFPGVTANEGTRVAPRSFTYMYYSSGVESIRDGIADTEEQKWGFSRCMCTLFECTGRYECMVHCAHTL